MASAIELTGLTKHFGEVVALEDVDLTVEEGEIFGFLGPNGAGKSTTIDTLLDFIRPTSGSARVLGLDAQRDSLEIRRRTGVLPDAYQVYDRLTGRQHVQFAIDSKGTDDDPLALLERVGIADAADRRAGGYSKGMRQRLVLAMALVGAPEILILDEPSTGLDPNGAREMRQLIREESERGATVFFSSHILEQVEAICDRVAILNKGRMSPSTPSRGCATPPARRRNSRLESTVPEGAIEAIEVLDGVQSVNASGTTVIVRIEDGSKTAILDVLESAGAEVLDFSTAETSLEELFAQFTTEPQRNRTSEADAPASETEAEPAEVAR